MATGTRNTMTLVDPTTRPMVADFNGAPRLDDLKNKRVGVIDDSKVNAKEFLHEVLGLLDERYGVANVDYHAKPSASTRARVTLHAPHHRSRGQKYQGCLSTDTRLCRQFSMQSF